MFKELILAVILGSMLGFGVTGGIVALKNNQTSNQQVSKSESTTSQPVTGIPLPSENPSDTLDTNNHQITIDSPQNESIVTNSKVSIKGSTTPQSYLIITTSTESYVATADNAGNFDIDIDIESGINQVQIDSIDSQDNQAATQLLITYSTAVI